MAKIAIILGSIREGRLGQHIAEWVACQAVGRNCQYNLVDLRDFPLPLFDAAVTPGQANKQYANPAVQKWANKIDEFDGYIFVTPEYNHNIPGPFKNAFDSIAGEWKGKPVGIVAYGFAGGVDVVEGWRKSTTGALQMKFIEETTNIIIPENFRDEEFTPTDKVADELLNTLGSLEALLA